MNNISCEIIEDVLPLCAENIASEATNRMVEEHIETCEKCRERFQKMKEATNIVPTDIGMMPMKKLQKKINRKRISGMVLSGLVVLLCSILAVIHLNSPIYFSGSQEAVSLIIEGEDGVEVFFVEKVTGYDVDKSEIDGNTVYSLTCWRTIWDKLWGRETKTISEVFEDIEVGDTIVFYGPGLEIDEVIYGDNSGSGGSITLPRLVLNYYLIFAILLLIAGMLVCVFIRKKDKKYIAAKLTLVPFAYVVASIMVLMGKGDIYNAQYYFTGIMLVAIVCYLLLYYLLGRLVWKEKANA